MKETETNFTTFAESTKEDWQKINHSFRTLTSGLADRVLAHLKLLDKDYGGFPVDRLEHSLQTATRAHQAEMDEEYVVCALIHDIGDTLATYNHPDVAAAILKPFVSEKNHWMVEKHGIFQGYYFFHHLGMDKDMREAFRGHPHFEYTAQFCHRFDQNSFDKNFTSMPLDAFEPMLRRVLEKPKNTIHQHAVNDDLVARDAVDE